ncbi:cytochrome P450 [Actinocorallia populi]|uniref:cytochrome P450 n=1 Tax=Actinocorallia populi TaxID=2079200 RepID=UPI000D089704|nr:cytochrome P450 [Actinocorallia populi]
MTVQTTGPAGLDLSDPMFWTRPLAERDAAFAHLRSLPSPVLFPEIDVPFIKGGDGYWALVRHADVVEASRRPEVFSSEPTTNSIADMPGYLARFFGSMINMDDPRHAKIRRIVSRAFTPRVLARLDHQIEETARGIVDGVLRGEGTGDFVSDVAARLPLTIICDMMGIPEADREMVLERSNTILGIGDPEYGVGSQISRVSVGMALTRLLDAGMELQLLIRRLGRLRRRRPGDDLVTALVHGNVDGEHLTDQELGSFFILLVVAGNETTRNAISHALKLLTVHEDQRALLLADPAARMPGAIEEVVRYATPVIQFRRTLARDTVLNGHPLREGEKVLLFYNSANRDEAVFPDPDRFDITRSPNPHVGFGGPGPHFCLGANLARREIGVMLRELYTRVPSLRSTAPPDRLLSGFINGIKHLPYEV